MQVLEHEQQDSKLVTIILLPTYTLYAMVCIYMLTEFLLGRQRAQKYTQLYKATIPAY